MTPAELKAQREAAGLDRETLGRLVGKSKRQIYRWEADENPIGLAEQMALRQVFDRLPQAITASRQGRSRVTAPRNGSARGQRRKAS